MAADGRIGRAPAEPPVSPTSLPDALVTRVERTWADHGVDFVATLRALDPTWGSESFPLAGGQVVLSGPGLFVNRALAVGLGVELAVADVEVLERRSRSVGVDPALELLPGADPSVAALSEERGYAPSGSVSVLTLPLTADLTLPPVVPGVDVEVADTDRLGVWQELAARGWGHRTPEARRASDAYAAAAIRTRGEAFFVAVEDDGSRVLGCASLTIRDGLATLGGMSTLPEERRRGVQRSLVRARLLASFEAGCDLAATSTEPGSGSERNLLRLGFRSAYRKSTRALRPTSAGRTAGRGVVTGPPVR